MVSKLKMSKEICLYTYDMIIYVENLMKSTKKLLELMYEFNKVAGHKLNIEKSGFYMLRQFPSILILLNVFIMKSY